jgi:hypothetical protein
MTNLIKPAPAAHPHAKTGIPSGMSAAEFIRELARRHGVAYQPSLLDDFATNASRLSDAEAPEDNIADLMVALQRAGVVDSKQAIDLLGEYLRQTRE